MGTRALRLLRMALKRQRPPHPGRVAELRGLDAETWRLCLHCWGIGAAVPCDACLVAGELRAARDNYILCPVGWTSDLVKKWVDARVPLFRTEMSAAEYVDSRRDISVENIEYKAYLTRCQSTLEVTANNPTHMRRSTLREDEVCVAGFSSRVLTPQSAAAPARMHDMVAAPAS